MKTASVEKRLAAGSVERRDARDRRRGYAVLAGVGLACGGLTGWPEMANAT